jgi:hypothetical protein
MHLVLFVGVFSGLHAFTVKFSLNINEQFLKFLDVIQALLLYRKYHEEMEYFCLYKAHNAMQ